MPFLRPDGDLAAGLWTTEAGGTTNLFASIDESTLSDTDYIQSGVNPSNDTVRFSLSNPGGAMAAPETVSFRYKKSLNSGTVNLKVRLLQGTTEIAAWTYSNISATYTDTTETLTSPQIAAITDATDLRLEFIANPAANDPISILGAKLLAWYDPKDLTTLYQTDDTSTPVTTNGQNVGRMSDKSGNGYHLIQPTAGSRPVYNTTGLGASSPSLDFDGSADFLSAAGVALGTTDKLLLATVLNTNPGSGSNRLAVFKGGTGNDWDNALNGIFFYFPVSPTIQGYRASGGRSSTNISLSTRVRLVSAYNGTTHVMTKNGVDETGVASTGNFDTSGTLVWGAGADGSIGTNPSLMKGGPVVLTKGTNLTVGEMTDLDAYLAAY